VVEWAVLEGRKNTTRELDLSSSAEKNSSATGEKEEGARREKNAKTAGS